MSQYERPDRLAPGRERAVKDIGSLASHVTPHFAPRARGRIARLIEHLPPCHPARIEDERQMERLLDLANHSGEPRQVIRIEEL